MQILGHVEDQVAGALAPLLQCPGQGGAVEGRLAHRVDSQRLEAVALTTALAAALGEPLAQRFERGHLAIIEFELLGRSSDRVAPVRRIRSEEHTSELQSLMRISYAVFCLKKTKKYYRKQY